MLRILTTAQKVSIRLGRFQVPTQWLGWLSPPVLLSLLGVLLLRPGPVETLDHSDHGSSERTRFVLSNAHFGQDYARAADMAGATIRLSVASGGTEGNDHSYYPSVSSNGNYVAFESFASNLVSGDSNGAEDVFVRDRLAGQTTRVSVASSGAQGNLKSEDPSISAAGRYVAFTSHASNLVSGDTNGTEDILVHDRQSGQTVRVSVASDSTQGNDMSIRPSISSSGRFVAYCSSSTNIVAGDTNGEHDIFLHDRDTDGDGAFDEAGAILTKRVSVASGEGQGNGISHSPSISASGRYIAFYSSASNLVSGDTNGVTDVFVHDSQTGQTTRISVASDRTQGDMRSDNPSISGNGLYVAFNSEATNLVSGDTNNYPDVFVHDRVTGQTTRVSVASDGTQGNRASDVPSISSTGRYVAFDSSASNLVSGDFNGEHDVFVHDRQTEETFLVSVATDGTQGNNISEDPSLSTNGRYVAFHSEASNLVSGDSNGVTDVFGRDWR